VAKEEDERDRGGEERKRCQESDEKERATVIQLGSPEVVGRSLDLAEAVNTGQAKIADSPVDRRTVRQETAAFIADLLCPQRRKKRTGGLSVAHQSVLRSRFPPTEEAGIHRQMHRDTTHRTRRLEKVERTPHLERASARRTLQHRRIGFRERGRHERK
jgi:hypothetical protein